jgi:ketohexokinase
MSDVVQWREESARKLLAAADAPGRLSAFLGLDGFVDEIVHVVDRRIDAEHFERIRTIKRFADRVAAAAGKSTNLELVNQRTKLGGNGPILADALACFGVNVTYLGALGYPILHPVFHTFAEHAQVHSICDACHTDALEFDDGKLLCGKSTPLKEMTWANIQARFGRDRFAVLFSTADLVGFVNWTMVFHMSELWEALLTEVCPSLRGPRRLVFFDLADPEKRSPADLRRALELIAAFQKYFEVVLGLNEREALAVGEVLGVPAPARAPEDVSALANDIQRHLRLHTVVVHPVAYAVAADARGVSRVDGPLCAQPLISTGAGDHFNAGFCLGKLLGFDNPLCLLTGVTTSGYYVRTAHSPSLPDLAEMLRHWPT